MQQNRFSPAARVLEAKLAATPPMAEDHFRLAALAAGDADVPKRRSSITERALRLPRAGPRRAITWEGSCAGSVEPRRRSSSSRAAHRLAPDDPANDMELGLACAAAGANRQALAALRRAAGAIRSVSSRIGN